MTNSIYKTRKQAMRGCIAEAGAAERFTESAIRLAAEGECRRAWNCADTAATAAKCAMIAHEALWELSRGKLTEEELAAFEAAEIAQTNARKAATAAGNAVAKRQAAWDAAH